MAFSTPRRAEPHWLIWDGDCGFCANAVAWFTDRDREGAFQPVTSQACASPPMTDAMRALATRAMIVLTRDGRQIAGGRAVLFVLLEIGWRPALVGLASLRPFVWAVDLGYRIVARNRQLSSHVLFRRDGQRGACSIHPEQRRHASSERQGDTDAPTPRPVAGALWRAVWCRPSGRALADGSEPSQRP